MSDKTCGNCKHDGCLYSQIPADREGCVGWSDANERSLEQRYKQLEQVAREAWKCLDSVPRLYKELYDVDGYARDCANMIREQLEALGVSIDD